MKYFADKVMSDRMVSKIYLFQYKNTYALNKMKIVERLVNMKHVRGILQYDK